MSDTPRTDAITNWDIFVADPIYHQAIMLARQLERELAEAKSA